MRQCDIFEREDELFLCYKNKRLLHLFLRLSLSSLKGKSQFNKIDTKSEIVKKLQFILYSKPFVFQNNIINVVYIVLIPEQDQTGLVCGYSSCSKAKVLLLLFAAQEFFASTEKAGTDLTKSMTLVKSLTC